MRLSLYVYPKAIRLLAFISRNVDFEMHKNGFCVAFSIYPVFLRQSGDVSRRNPGPYAGIIQIRFLSLHAEAHPESNVTPAA